MKRERLLGKWIQRLALTALLAVGAMLIFPQEVRAESDISIYSDNGSTNSAVALSDYTPYFNLPTDSTPLYFTYNFEYNSSNKGSTDSSNPDNLWKVEKVNDRYRITLLQDSIEYIKTTGVCLSAFKGNIELNLGGNELTLNSSKMALYLEDKNSVISHLTITNGTLNLIGCGYNSSNGLLDYGTNNNSIITIDNATLNITNKGSYSMFTHSRGGSSSPQFIVKDGATVTLKNEGVTAMSSNFVAENSGIQFSYNGTPISIDEINSHKGDSSWTIWTETPETPTVNDQTEKKEDKNEPQYEPQSQPDTSRKSDYATDVIRVCFPRQNVFIPLKAFKTDEKTTNNIILTMTGYAASLSKSAQLLDSFIAEPPSGYTQGKEIQITIKNPNIKAGDTVVLNVFNEFDTPATQEFYTVTATKDGEVTFTIKHIGLMSLFQLK